MIQIQKIKQVITKSTSCYWLKSLATPLQGNSLISEVPQRSPEHSGKVLARESGVSWAKRLVLGKYHLLVVRCKMTRLQLSLTLPKTTALISRGLVSAYPFVRHCFQKHLRLLIDFLACLVESLEEVYELFSHSIRLNAGLPVYGGTGSFGFLNFCWEN